MELGQYQLTQLYTKVTGGLLQDSMNSHNYALKFQEDWNWASMNSHNYTLKLQEFWNWASMNSHNRTLKLQEDCYRAV